MVDEESRRKRAFKYFGTVAADHGHLVADMNERGYSFCG